MLARSVSRSSVEEPCNRTAGAGIVPAHRSDERDARKAIASASATRQARANQRTKFGQGERRADERPQSAGGSPCSFVRSTPPPCDGTPLFARSPRSTHRIDRCPGRFSPHTAATSGTDARRPLWARSGLYGHDSTKRATTMDGSSFLLRWICGSMPTAAKRSPTGRRQRRAEA